MCRDTLNPGRRSGARAQVRSRARRDHGHPHHHEPVAPPLARRSPGPPAHRVAGRGWYPNSRRSGTASRPADSSYPRSIQSITRATSTGASMRARLAATPCEAECLSPEGAAATPHESGSGLPAMRPPFTGGLAAVPDIGGSRGRADGSTCAPGSRIVRSSQPPQPC